MKLIRCPLCNDIVALTSWRKSCKCGSVYGKYIDNLRAKVSPGAILMAADSDSILNLNGKLFSHKVRDLTLEIPTTEDYEGCDIEFEEFKE